MHRRALGLGDQRIGGLLHAIVREAVGVRPSATADPPRAPPAARRRDRARRRSASVSRVHGGAEAGGELRAPPASRPEGHAACSPSARRRCRCIPGRGCARDPSASGAPSRSNEISPCRCSAVRNWMTKNGLPPVLSRTRWASGSASRGRAVDRVGDELAHVGLAAAARSRRVRISAALPRALRRARASAGGPGRPRCRGRRRSAAGGACSGGDQQSTSSFRLAGSAHCRSSRNRASGCSVGRERAHELAQHPAQPVLGLAERQLRHRRLRADDQLHLGDEVDDELSVRPHRRLRCAAARPRCSRRSRRGCRA